MARKDNRSMYIYCMRIGVGIEKPDALRQDPLAGICGVSVSVPPSFFTMHLASRDDKLPFTLLTVVQ